MEVQEWQEREIRNLIAENTRLRGRMALLAEIAQRVTASLDLPTVLQAVVDGACALTTARYGALAMCNASGQILQFITHGVSDEERARIGGLPKGLGLLGWLRQLQEPLRLADLSQHPRSVGFPPCHPLMKTFLGAPLRFSGEALGNLYLAEKEGGYEFTPEDEHFLVVFAAQAALAIRNARIHDGVETERRQMEALVEASPVGVVVVDAPSCIVLLANPEAARLFGVQRGPGIRLAQYLKGVVFRTADARTYAATRVPLERALTGGEAVAAEEILLERPDSTTVPVLMSATPVTAPDGTLTAVVVILQDITPLEEIERLRSEFLGMVSHELRTPLTAIKGSAAVARSGQRALDAEEAQELFGIIDEQADRLRDLVDNLLDMTRIEAGRLTVNPEPTQLGMIIHEAVTAFLHGGAKQQVTTRVPEALPPVQADQRRIGQVVSNLLHNAAKFSSADAVITVAAEHTGGSVAVRVIDTGQGIPAAKMPLLFKKFSQVHEGARGLGTGLGLAIAKGIVESHGGRIWAESPGEGHGATFTFTLPVAAEAASQASVDAVLRTARLGHARRQGERTRVLAVDDDVPTLRYVRRTLEEAGFSVVSTPDPSAVMRLMEADGPDLIVLDLVLPGTSGFEVLRHIREVSGAPVIFLTGNTSEEDMVRALRLGADDYIIKPFSPSELVARVEASLRRRLAPDAIEIRPALSVGDLTINLGRRHVTVRETPVPLTATEYKLLYELAIHVGRVLTHDQILLRVWGPEYAGATELLRSAMRNLRRKLGDDARQPRYIFTEARVGYRLSKPTAA